MVSFRRSSEGRRNRKSIATRNEYPPESPYGWASDPRQKRCARTPPDKCEALQCPRARSLSSSTPMSQDHVMWLAGGPGPVLVDGTARRWYVNTTCRCRAEITLLFYREWSENVKASWRSRSSCSLARSSCSRSSHSRSRSSCSRSSRWRLARSLPVKALPRSVPEGADEARPA